jgi:hypothetical protein
MKFFALLKVHQNTQDKMALYEFIEEMGGDEGMWNLPPGVKMLESGKIFGSHDLAVFYEAPDEETAMKVMSEMSPYATIDRFLTTPCPWCENVK